MPPSCAPARHFDSEVGRAVVGRFGTIVREDALVADAVASSAAYPLFFPSLERSYRFAKDGRTTNPRRVMLADGGVFENLAVSPMEPGRDPDFSTNVFDPDYIICCDAGVGLFDDLSYPRYWFRRMRRSFLTTFRKLQDSTRKRLHDLDAADKIGGFVLCYLGQQDPFFALDSVGYSSANRSS